MTSMRPTPDAYDMAAQSAAWRIGERVARIGSGNRGTVDEVTEHAVKIKWDSGATSYYRRDDVGRVLLKEPPQQPSEPT